MLHLVPRAVSAAAIAEAARVLRPGGTLVTTVDKNDGQYRTGRDVEEILWPQRVRLFHPNPDDRDRIAGLGQALGLRVAGEATFLGLGQGRSPMDFQKQLTEPAFGWVERCDADLVADLNDRLAALSDQDRPRGDPVYRLLAMTKL
jgi:SAM-dependent methyltransferase